MSLRRVLNIFKIFNHAISYHMRHNAKTSLNVTVNACAHGRQQSGYIDPSEFTTDVMPLLEDVVEMVCYET